jgi:hypothetical protein
MALLGAMWSKQATRWRLWLALIGWAGLNLSSDGLRAALLPPEVSEYQIKAVFLFNFAQFVDWPNEAFQSAQSPLVIGILGDDPFGSYLDQAVRGERVKNRPMVVRRYSRVADVTDCHILFISESETGRLDQILEHLKGRSILTVGDSDGFSQLGGIIRFATENSKVRLKINLRAAKQAHLTISSKLLRPAEIVSMRQKKLRSGPNLDGASLVHVARCSNRGITILAMGGLGAGGDSANTLSHGPGTDADPGA